MPLIHFYLCTINDIQNIEFAIICGDSEDVFTSHQPMMNI